MNHRSHSIAKPWGLGAILAIATLALVSVAGCGPATPVPQPTASNPASTTVAPATASTASSTASGRARFSVGDLFAGIGDGKFNRFDSTGTLIETLDDGQTVPGENATSGMCFDPAGNMYATNVRANSMSKFSIDGTLLAATIGTFNAQPESCLITDGNTMFTGEVAGTGDILKLDLSGARLASYDVPRSDWIDLTADGCTMFYTDEGRTIHRFDVCTNAPLKDFVTGGLGFYALRILPDGSVLAAGTSAIKRFSPSGTEIASYTAAGENWFFALNLDPDGTHFWSGGFRTGVIYKFDLTPVGPPVLRFSAQVAKSGGTELAGLAVFGELVASQPSTAPPFRDSVPTPAEVTLDPVIVAQSIAIAAGMVILVPFPAILFNRTLEENYPEIVRRVRRARRRLGVRRRLGGLFALLMPGASGRLRLASASGQLEPTSGSSDAGPDSVRIDPELEQNPRGGFWRTPLGMLLFVLLSALLYGFLDPTFGLDSQSLAAFAGLAAGLVVTLLAFCVPLALAYARSAIPLSIQALPGTLAVGLACVLLTRVTDFHPGYLYGLVVTFVVARELSVAVEGKAMAMATGTTLVVAVVAWFGLLWIAPLTPAQGDPGLALIALQTALVMALVAGVELTVFGMLPLRFLPGENVYRWKRRIWAILFGLGMFGFVHILMNPKSGYLADTTRTPMVTIVLLLLFFALFSVAFWAYFRFRRVPEVPAPAS
jgi:hypothetical protein